MSRPTVAPDWATATNFASGPIIGQPNKAQPSGGEVTEGFDPATYFQVEKINFLLNNHAEWLKTHESMLLGEMFHVSDDFLATPGGFWAIQTGSPPFYDDSASGLFGSVRLHPAGNVTKDLESIKLPISNKDFWINIRGNQSAALAAGDEAGFGFTDGAHDIVARCKNGVSSGRWTVSIDGGAYVDSTVAATGVQNIILYRSGNTVGFGFDMAPGDTPIYTVAYSSTFTGANTYFYANAIGTGGGSTVDWRIDHIKMWVAR